MRAATFGRAMVVGVFALLSAIAPEKACAQPTLDEVLSAIPDSTMRARWIEARAQGRLPPVEVLTRPSSTPIQRERVVAQDPRLQGTVGGRDEGDAEGVQMSTERSVSTYDGLFDAVVWQDGRISGRLREGGIRFSIDYQLPGVQQALERDRSPSTPLSFREEVVGGSLRQEIILGSDSMPILYYLSDGANSPVSRHLEAMDLHIVQRPPGSEGVSPVEFRWGEIVLVVPPGQRQQLGSGELEVFLISSAYTSPSAIAGVDGDPYHVTLMIYRRRAP